MRKWGGRLPHDLIIDRKRGRIMFTISDVIRDINRGIAANNMAEDKFSYRITFFINEGSKGERHQNDTAYGSLRESLEKIIKDNLSLTNNIVIANTTTIKDGKCIRLQSRQYNFSLDGYFRQLSGECKSGTIAYGRYAVR